MTMSVPLLPPELVLKIFHELDLVGLIKATNICTRWRTLVSVSGVIQKEHLSLLQHYKDTIASPSFLASRESLLPRLISNFDRPKYVSDLKAQYPGYALPTELTLWILEWPSRACDKYWPGLRHAPNPEGYSWLTCPDLSQLIAKPSIPYSRAVYFEGPNCEDAGLEEAEMDATSVLVWTTRYDHATFLVVGDCDERYGQVDEFTVVSPTGNVKHNFSDSWSVFLRKQL